MLSLTTTMAKKGGGEEHLFYHLLFLLSTSSYKIVPSNYSIITFFKTNIIYFCFNQEFSSYIVWSINRSKGRESFSLYKRIKYFLSNGIYIKILQFSVSDIGNAVFFHLFFQPKQPRVFISALNFPKKWVLSPLIDSQQEQKKGGKTIFYTHVKNPLVRRSHTQYKKKHCWRVCSADSRVIWGLHIAG